MNWISALAELQRSGEPCVLVTIIEERLADYRAQPAIDAPATPERVLWGVEQMRRLKAAQAQAADAAVEPA